MKTGQWFFKSNPKQMTIASFFLEETIQAASERAG
jgi:hypothetical protein